MKKAVKLFICVMIFFAFTSISLAVSSVDEFVVTTNTIPPEPPTMGSINNTVNTVIAMMTWVGYAIAVFLIIFAIIKGIIMVVKKKPIGKTILFVFIMFAIATVLILVTTMMSWIFTIGS